MRSRCIFHRDLFTHEHKLCRLMISRSPLAILSLSFPLRLEAHCLIFCGILPKKIHAWPTACAPTVLITVNSFIFIFHNSVARSHISIRTFTRSYTYIRMHYFAPTIFVGINVHLSWCIMGTFSLRAKSWWLQEIIMTGWIKIAVKYYTLHDSTDKVRLFFSFTE